MLCERWYMNRSAYESTTSGCRSYSSQPPIARPASLVSAEVRRDPPPTAGRTSVAAKLAGIWPSWLWWPRMSFRD
jgi:hypothetical protein